MKLGLTMSLLSGILLFSCTDHKPRDFQNEAIETFIIPANKAYAEPYTLKNPGVTIPVGWPETIDVVSEWKDPSRSVVWYLYMKPGSYDFYFNSKTVPGKKLSFRINISECYPLGLSPINRLIKFQGSPTGSDTVFASRVDIKKTGYYRYELKPMTDPESAIIINNLIFYQFDKDMKAQVNHTNYQSSPSAHIHYSTTANTSGTYDWVYQEVLVPEGMDPYGTFYTAIGYYRGYLGIQTNSDTERRVLFSVWDRDHINGIVSADDYVKFVDKDPDTTTNSFGGEGTGGQSFVRNSGWKTGRPIKFLLNLRKVKPNAVIHSAWYNVDDEGWKYVASWATPDEERLITGFHSFIENYTYTNGQFRREAYYYNTWARDIHSGKWVYMNKGRYTHTDGNEGQRIDYEQGVSPDFPDRFYMSSGGYTPTFIGDTVIPLLDCPPVPDIKTFEERVDKALHKTILLIKD